MATERVAMQLAAGVLGALGLVLRAIAAVAGSATSDSGTNGAGGHVRTSAGIEPAATDEDGRLVGAHSGSHAIEVVTSD